MNLLQYLNQGSAGIVDEAATAVSRANLAHYKAAGPDVSRLRLQKLYGVMLDCIGKQNVLGMVRYSQALAEERFSSGFDLSEVQTAINVLEEVIWKRVLGDFPPQEFAGAIGMVSTVLGIGKDTLARNYVSLATKTKAPSLDLKALFDGTEGL